MDLIGRPGRGQRMNEGHGNLQRHELEEYYRDNSRTVNNNLGMVPEIIGDNQQSVPALIPEGLESLLENQLHNLSLERIGEHAPEAKQCNLTDLIWLATWAWSTIGLLGA